MILYLLTVFILLSLNDAEVEIETENSTLTDVELVFKSSRHLITHEEAERSDNIIKKNLATAYTIEVLVMLDYSVYSWWVDLNRGDSQKAISELHTFYANIFTKIKERFKQVKVGNLHFNIKVVDIVIAKSKSEVPFVENKYKVSEDEVNIHSVLHNLTSWLKDNRKQFTRHDIFALFTKYHTGIFNGLAWPEAACSDHGISVTREMGFYDTYHSACHEIGHNLGAHHDDASDCPYNSQYIMAAGTEYFTDKNFKNRRKFSPCSHRNFTNFIEKINKESSNCLVIQSAKKSIELKEFMKAPLGTQFDIDKQCQIYFGPNSFYCAGHSNIKTSCREINCWNPVHDMCHKSPKFVPADGTPCDSKMSCKDEACVSDLNVKSARENCYYGDWKGKVLDHKGNDMGCEHVRKGKTFICYQPEMSSICCESCGKVYEPEKSGCAYGDRVEGCKKSECTYDSVITCCKTCEVNVSDPCQFGDKAKWCKDLKPFECYQSANICCKTCKDWEDKTDIGCEYGDKDASCENSKCTYDSVSTCCRSCKANASDTCQFGDKASWCSTIKPFQCYQNENICCETCKRLEDKTKKDCRYGDAQEYCESSIRKRPLLCNQTTYQKDCCSSCEFIKTPQCIDLDPTYCPKIIARNCYQKNNLETCCKRCSDLQKVDAPKGCEYGDRSNGCQSWHCLKNREQCCYTCRNHN